MIVAMTDMDIVWEDKDANRRQCVDLVREAGEHRADVILFPEMTLTGFSMNLDAVKDEGSESILFFAELARQYGMAVGFGYVAVRGGKGRNHFCFVDAGGEVLADYEKIHPFTCGGEAEFYEGGDRICSFVWNGFRCGVFICYDLRFPEAFQQLPPDTDVVFVAANWPEGRLEHWYTLLKARAIEMQCYVVGVNRVGSGGGVRYVGSSVAFAADGSRLAEGAGDRNRYVELDRDRCLAYRKEFPTRPDRRPEVYLVTTNK